MSTPTIEATDIILLQNPATVALGHLKDGANPFTYTVVTAGSEEQCEAYDVPEIHDSQISDCRTQSHGVNRKRRAAARCKYATSSQLHRLRSGNRSMAPD